MRRARDAALGAVGLLSLAASAFAQDDLVVTQRTSKPPVELADAIETVLTTVSGPLAASEIGTGLKGVVFGVPVSRDGQDGGTLRFGLVLAGPVQT